MKKKLVLVVVAAAVAFVWLRSSGGGAPLADGSFLQYRQGDAMVRLTFHLVGGDSYRSSVEITHSDGESEVGEHMSGHDETVDGRMRTASGAIFELGSFGPLWVSPGQLKEGGSAYGQRITEVRPLNGREVAVVSASVGVGAALRGEWYYDVVTGFLVAGMMSTAVSGQGQGMSFELVDTNIVGLALLP
jgi:hypothetical protein